MRLVLRQDADPHVAGIDEVGEYEINQPIACPERHGRFRPVGSQWPESLALAAGKHHAQYPGLSRHGLTLSAPHAPPQGYVSASGDDTIPRMHVGILTREYPPEVYGGAGVH